MVLPRRPTQPAAAATGNAVPQQGSVSFQTNEDDDNRNVENVQPSSSLGLMSPPLPLTPYPHRKKQRVLNDSSTTNYLPNHLVGNLLTSHPEKHEDDDAQFESYNEQSSGIGNENSIQEEEVLNDSNVTNELDINEDSLNNNVHDTGLVMDENSNMTTTMDTTGTQEDPDWDKLAEHEPARTDIPLFLEARQRRYATEERFANALDEAHASLHRSVDAILQVAADLHAENSRRLDALEEDIIENMVHNYENREAMEQRLQESAAAAQGIFAELMMRVSQPLMKMADSVMTAKTKLSASSATGGYETAATNEESQQQQQPDA